MQEFKDKENFQQEMNDNHLENDNLSEKTENQSENISEENKKIEELENLLNEEKDRFLRLFAEFENYKKRTSKERIDLLKTAGQEVIQALLPVLDDFDRALVEIQKSEDENLVKGVELIQNKFFNTLKSKGLDLVETNASDDFDSEIHEAITMIPAPNENLKGKIIDVVQKGYKLGDKIIRFPKVVVGQ